MKSSKSERIILMGQEGMFMVHQTLDKNYPGYVRTLHISAQCQILVEYEVYGLQEGGTNFWGKYSDEQHMVDSIENYIGMTVAEWQRLTPAERHIQRPANLSELLVVGHRKLEYDIKNNSVCLPFGTDFTLKSTHWEQYLSENTKYA